MKTEKLKIKYPSCFEYALYMTKNEAERILLMSGHRIFELAKISSVKAEQIFWSVTYRFL